jgi:hypothetical protein
MVYAPNIDALFTKRMFKHPLAPPKKGLKKEIAHF